MYQMVFKLSDGNLGATMCLTTLLNTTQDLNTGASIEKREFIMEYIQEHNIIGANLHVLYSDISNKNLGLLYHIVKNAPVNDVINAASKQDHSGREILEKYIDSYTFNGYT